MATHNLDEPPMYPPNGLGGRVDVLARDLAETRAALHQSCVERDAARKEALQWKARADYYRDRIVLGLGQHFAWLFEHDRPDLFVGEQEVVDRSG